jgi:hypothetical protein
MKKEKYVNMSDSTKQKSNNTSIQSSPFDLKSMIGGLRTIHELKDSGDSIRKLTRKKKIAHQMQFDNHHTSTLYSSYVGFKNLYVTSNNTEANILKVTEAGIAPTIPNTFYETIKTCKSMGMENIQLSRFKSTERLIGKHLYESIEGKLIGLNDPRKEVTSRGLFERSKDKFLCRYLMDTKKEKIVRYNEDCENAITKIEEDMKEFVNSKRLLDNFTHKFDDFMRSINEKREIEKDELFKLRQTYRMIDKQSHNVNLAMKKIWRDIEQGTEYRNFLIMVKERLIELPKFMSQLINLHQLKNSPSPNKSSSRGHSKSVTKQKFKRSEFSLLPSQSSINGDNKELERYYKYLTDENIFSNTEEFICIIRNLEDENLRLLSEYHKLVDIKKQLLMEISRKHSEDRNRVEDDGEERRILQEKVNKLKKRNEYLKRRKDEVLKQGGTPGGSVGFGLITTNDKNIARMIANLTELIDKNPGLTRGRHFIINKNSNADIVRLARIEYIVDGLQHESAKYEANPEYKKFIEALKEKLQLRIKARKTEYQKRIIMLKKQKIIDSIINKSHRSVIRHVRRFDKRFKPKGKKVKAVVKNSFDSNNFNELIDYEDNN